MSNPFANLAYEAEQAVEKDVLFTGNAALESDIYLFDIKYMYMSQSKSSKAQAVNLELTTADGKRHREQIWITNAEGKNKYAKKGETKEEYSSGFLLANSICLLACGKPLTQVQVETKTINLYNYDQKKDVPTDVQMITSVLGRPIKLAIQKQRVNKQKKNTQSGKYEPVNEERFESVIAKAFRADSNKTEAEIRAQGDAKFHDEWLEANKGKTKDRYKEVKGNGTQGAPQGNFAGGSNFNPNEPAAGSDPFAMM